MRVSQREIFLVPFPFSDLSTSKVRPVVILSGDSFNATSRDVIVCGITSNIKRDRYTLLFGNDDLEEGRLLTQSAIKVPNLLKIAKKLLIKKIGKLRESPFRLTLDMLLKIVS